MQSRMTDKKCMTLFFIVRMAALTSDECCLKKSQ